MIITDADSHSGKGIAEQTAKPSICHAAWRSTGSTESPMIFTPRLSNSGAQRYSHPMMVVCAIAKPCSAIISIKSRRLNLNRTPPLHS